MAPAPRPHPNAARLPDLVERGFTATAFDRLYVADFTYIRSWEGMVFFAFVIDVFSRRVVGWRLASYMRASLVLRRAADGAEHPRISALSGDAAAGVPPLTAAYTPRCSSAPATVDGTFECGVGIRAAQTSGSSPGSQLPSGGPYVITSGTAYSFAVQGPPLLSTVRYDVIATDMAGNVNPPVAVSS